MKKLLALSLLFLSSIAQADLTNLSSWIFDSNGNPINLGQTTMANGLPVSLASNQSAIPVSQSGSWTNACTQSGTWTVQQGSPPWSVSISGSTGTSSINLAQVGGVSTAVGAGSTNTGTQRVASNTYDGLGNAITSDSPGSAGNQRLHVATPDTTVASTALGALNANISLTLGGLTGVGFVLSAGTLIGTLTPQISMDGSNWINTLFYDPATQATSSTIVFSSSNTLTTRSIIVSGGATQVRVLVSSYTSGTANAIMRGTQATSTQITTAGGAVSTGTVFSIASLALNMATAGNENPLILIKNPSGNTKSIYVESAYCGILTANRAAAFNIYSSPTVTANGTAMTIVNRSIGSGTASAMQAFTAPTVSANGTLFSTFIVGQNTNSNSILDAFNLKLPPNTQILITGNPNANGTSSYLTVTWSEY